MAVNPGDILRVDMIFTETATGSDFINAYQLKVNAGSPVNEADLLTDLLAWAEAAALLIKLVVSTVQTFQKIKAINLTQHSSVGEAAFVTTTVGADAGDPLPPQVAGVVTFHTFDITTRGRKYYGMSEEGDQSQGAWNAGHVTNLVNIASHFLSDYTGAYATLQHGVLKKATGVWYPFLSANVSQITATQRRRRRTVGS